MNERHSNEGGDGPDDHLDEQELSALRQALGSPSPEKIRGALDEVAFQVAMEDLTLLIIEGLTETARTLIDAVTGLGSDSDIGDRDVPPGREES